MEKQLNSNGIFSQDFRHWLQTRRVQGPDHLHVNVQWHWLVKKKERWKLYLECRKGQGLRDDILARTLDVSRSWIGRAVVWKIFLLSKRRMGLHSQQNGTAIQRNRSSGCSEASVLWVVGSWRWSMVETPYTSMEIQQTQNSCSKQFIL